MKIETPSSVDWMPPHFSKLSRLCIKHGASPEVRPMCWGLSISAFSEPHVKLLSSAASKYRLAQYCEGLQGPSEEVRSAEGLGAEYFSKYSAQAMVMLSFVALEAYLRMLDTTWQKYSPTRSGVEHRPIAQLLRQDLDNGAFPKLKAAMHEAKLRKRLESFWDGDDSELLAVISALRNSFAHGKMGISKSVGVDCAQELKTYLLSVIREDAELISRSLEAQDATLLNL